jgi:probable O-glycosylation ligase (exosortase A-associated)
MKGFIFTYVLSYGGAVASVFNPFIGLLIYICFAIVRPESMWYWSVPRDGNYSRIVALGLLAGWALQGFGRWQLGRARGMVIALIGYWLWTVILATWAIDQSVALEAVEVLTKIVLPVVVGITTIDSVRQLKQLAWVIVLSQGYVALEANLTYFSGYNRLWEEGFGGMDNNCNAIAFVTCTGMAFFLGLRTDNLWLKGLAFAAAALMAHGILFSFSRGGMLALLVTGIVSFWLLPKTPKNCLLFAVAALAVVRLAGPQVVARFETAFAESATRDDAAESRLALWSVCWDLMQKNPQGIGPDHFGLVVADYGFRPGKLAHSVWLQIGAEAGFVGLACLLLYYGLCVTRLWPLARESGSVPDPWLRVAARMVIAALVGFAVSAQFVSLKNLEVPYYVALVGAATLKLCAAPATVPDPAADLASDLPGECPQAGRYAAAASEVGCGAV